MTRHPVEWVKYHAAKMGFLLTTRLHGHWPAHGAASILLHQYLANGQPLPDDDEQLALFAGGTPETWKQVSGAVRSLFYLGRDGMLHQQELDNMLAETEEFLTAKRNFGREGGKAKAENERVARLRGEQEAPP